MDERFSYWPVEVLEDKGDAMVGVDEEAGSGVLYEQEKLTKLKTPGCENCTQTRGLCSNSQKRWVS